MSPRRWALALTTIALLLALLGGFPQAGRGAAAARASRFHRRPRRPLDLAPDGSARGVRRLPLPPCVRARRAAVEHFVVHVSADNRYRLFVNGEQVSSGPQRSDLMHWRYETVDLAPHLRAGRNVLAALVWNWGPERPVAQFSQPDGVSAPGRQPARGRRRTRGPEWKVLPQRRLRAHPGRRACGRRLLRGARRASRSTREPLPVGLGAARLRGRRLGQPPSAGRGLPRSERTQLRGEQPHFGEAGGWQLVPRSIPPMEENAVPASLRVRPQRAASRRERGVPPSATGDLVVPAQHPRPSSCSTRLTSPTPIAVLETSGGAGSTVGADLRRGAQGREGATRGTATRSTARPSPACSDVFRPGRRRHVAASRRSGSGPTATCSSRSRPGDAALRIHDLHGIFTGLPVRAARALRQRPALARRRVGDGLARRPALRVGDLLRHPLLRAAPVHRRHADPGAHLALHERTTIDSCARRSEHFDLSRIPEGITASRYPSDLGQYIPTFSLIWVAMVHDYWMHRDDARVRRAASCPAYPERPRLVRSDGSTRPACSGRIPWWPYVDWARAVGRAACPRAGVDGHSDGHHACSTSYALERAQRRWRTLWACRTMADARPGRRAAVVRDAVRGADLGRRPRAVPGRARASTLYSQQTNILAVLTDAVAPAEHKRARDGARARRTRSLTQATYYFSFYLFEALRAGRPRRPLRRAASRPWQGMLALGLTTAPENPGADSIRLARLERAPELRPARHRARRAAGLARVANRADRASSRTTAQGRRSSAASAGRHRSPSTAA